MQIPAKGASSALEDAYVSMVRKKLAPILEARAAEIEAEKRAEEEAAAEEAKRAAEEAERERIAAEARREEERKISAGCACCRGGRPRRCRRGRAHCPREGRGRAPRGQSSRRSVAPFPQAIPALVSAPSWTRSPLRKRS